MQASRLLVASEPVRIGMDRSFAWEVDFASLAALSSKLGP